MKKIVVIVGPTASGKTKLSVELAKRIDSEIINGDSVQIYQRLDIGSAKIKEEEKQGIKHHLFDVCDPKQTYTAYQFQKDVRNLIDKIETPMIVGGTGLYIKSALYDYEFEDEDDKVDVEKMYQDVSNEELYEKLLILDPNINIDMHNRRRLLRALALAHQGNYRSEKQNKDQPLYDLCIIYLDLDRKVLEERLHIRLEKQLEEGFIDEVKALKEDGIKINAIGYREIDQYLDDILTYEEMKKEIIKKSKALAKKQKTWFKNQMHAHMLDALSDDLVEQATNIVLTFLEE
ncbi:tRNA (adenosine(37)-N6)-dimethylallyltransferase MiaA [Tenericutes bacterium MO-XQ]|nr:tRNA (adenosine(37)-N6)-dimethylallyltransferase MiaA [Tenericutes bacterium MO-XQ]